MRKGETEINVRRRRQRQSRENVYKRVLWHTVMSLSQVADVMAGDMGTAFQQALSSKQFP